MVTVTAYEAKTHLSRLLEQVRQGKRITITRHGTPVAELVPISGTARRPVEELIAELRELRKGQKLGGVRLKDLIEEGRR